MNKFFIYILFCVLGLQVICIYMNKIQISEVEIWIKDKIRKYRDKNVSYLVGEVN